MSEPLLHLQDIKRVYGWGDAEVRALDGVDLTIRESVAYSERDTGFSITANRQMYGRDKIDLLQAWLVAVP